MVLDPGLPGANATSRSGYWRLRLRRINWHMSRITAAFWFVVIGALLYALYPKSPRAVSGDATEVTVWFNGPLEGRFLDVTDAFERRFPNYRAIMGSSAVRTGLDGEGNPQRLMCGIAGGVPPEVVEYDRFAICQWAARGAFLDLTQLIEKDQRRIAEIESQLKASPANAAALEAELETLKTYQIRPENFYPQTWGECQYKGGVYGVPNFMDDRVLYCNTDLLIQSGFVDERGAARPPRTWEEVLTKRVDVSDASVADGHIRSATADFVANGVKRDDTVAVLGRRGGVYRCVVDDVVSPTEIRVRSAYSRKRLDLPAGDGSRIKVFDSTGYALTMTRWDEEGRIKIVGFEPQQGNAWLYLYGWCNGGEFLSDDGLTCTLNDPRIVEALQWTTDIYDALGGADEVNAFKKSFQTAAQDPFLLGQIALFINGDWFLRDVARYRRDMPFVTAPAPVPAARIAEGKPFSTWVAGFAYCIPSTCPPDKLDAAWMLVKFLSSVDGGQVQNEHDAQRERGQGRIYMPRMVANKKLTAVQMEKYIDAPDVPPRIRAAIQTHIDMLPHARYRPISPEGQKLWNAQADAQDLAWSHSMTPQAALDYQTRRVQKAIDQFHNAPADSTHVSWALMTVIYVVLLILTAAYIFRRFKRSGEAKMVNRTEWRTGLAFIAPWLVGFIVLSGGPMVFSAIMSLTRYDVINPARYVGTDNYREMFTEDWGGPGADGQETVPTGVRRSLLNTLFMAIGLPIGMAVGLGLALLLDSRVRGLRTYRTFFFLPSIMPIVAASILWIWVFNAQNGLLNWVLQATGIETLISWLSANTTWLQIKTPIAWLTNKQTSKPALIIMGLWGAGASMIIWLAGLKDIPTHLYEAAALDGAGPIRRFFRITLPMLSPHILFNLIIGLIATFQIFTQAYIMTPNGYPERSTYFYVYKLFDECFSFFRLGYGAAMAWVLFGILIVLTLINMRISKRWVHYAGE